MSDAGARGERSSAGLLSAIPWTVAAVTVLALHVVFFGLAYWAAGAPRERFRERVRSAFATTELVQADYLVLDSRRGNHQYDECLILQMLSNASESRVRRAVGPVLFIQDSTATGYCRTLHRLVVEGADPSEFLRAEYTRYWHGYLPVAAGFLSVTDLTTARRTLKALTYLSLILLAIAGLRSRCPPARIVALSVALCGLLLWGLPYLGQLFSHAAGDIVVVLGILVLLVFPEQLRRPRRFVPFCAAYGACVVFLEFLTGQLPIAAGLLFGTAYAVALCGTDSTRRGAWTYAGTGVVAFGAGGIATLLAKQVLEATVLGVRAFSYFIEGFGYHTASAATGSGSPGLVRVVRRLLQKVDILTYGNETAAIFLGVVSVLTWLAAAVVAIWSDRARDQGFAGRSDLLALAAGSSIVAAWVVLFQTHTLAHAAFMVRIAIVPVAFGWAALLWQIHPHFRRAVAHEAIDSREG